jgi:alpha-1,2-mannosyltransferase
MMPPAYLLFTLVLTLLLCPFAFRITGWFIRWHTSARRESLLARARETNGQGLSSSVEDDWEKVDAVVGTAPNGEKPDKDWKGVVGFFHPFW